MKISVIKNYLSNKNFFKICELINQEDFVWFKSNENFLFHTFISNNETLSNFAEVCDFFKEKIDRKIKTASVFLIPQRTDKQICLDFEVQPLSIIYDLTTCNGQTILPNNYEFKSIENSAIIINVKSKVHQIHQSDLDYRIVFYLSFN